MRIIIGIVFVVAGLLLVIFSRYIFDNFGRLPWAEDKLGPTGTLSLMRIVGALSILLGFFIWTGLFDIIFGGIFELLFGGLRGAMERQP
jgi:hypothetical protein